jgi:hypothetical protein
MHRTCPKHRIPIPDEIIALFNWPNSFQPHYDPGVDSASNKNEYQEMFLGVKGERPARKADNLTAISEPIV